MPRKISSSSWKEKIIINNLYWSILRLSHYTVSASDLLTVKIRNGGGNFVISRICAMIRRHASAEKFCMPPCITSIFRIRDHCLRRNKGERGREDVLPLRYAVMAANFFERPSANRERASDSRRIASFENRPKEGEKDYASSFCIRIFFLGLSDSLAILHLLHDQYG